MSDGRINYLELDEATTPCLMENAAQPAIHVWAFLFSNL